MATVENGSSVIVATSSAIQEHQQVDTAIIEKALMCGDVAKLDPSQRVQFYRAVCASVGLNPLTQPFTFLKRQDGTLWPYPNASCGEQLRKLHRVSTRIVQRQHEDIFGERIYRVEAEASTPDGRSYMTQSVVPLMKAKLEPTGQKWPDGKAKMREKVDENGEAVMTPLRGVELANALMKADTKAMRRATMGLVGLGWLEQEDYGSYKVRFNMQTGEVIEAHSEALTIKPIETPSDEQANKIIDDVWGERKQASVFPGTPPAEDDMSEYEGLRMQIREILDESGQVSATWRAEAEKALSDLTTSPGYLVHLLETTGQQEA